jgi:hypothetical protein
VRKLVQLVLLVAVAYFGITRGLPWVRNWVDSVTQEKIEGRTDPSLDATGYCVHLAHQAGAFVSRELRDLSPPPADSTRWVDAADEIEERVRSAENACSCPSDACEVATQALLQIRDLVAEANRILLGDTGLAPNFARRQEEIDALLEQARVHSR